jgi:hypothetical protein
MGQRCCTAAHLEGPCAPVRNLSQDQGGWPMVGASLCIVGCKRECYRQLQYRRVAEPAEVPWPLPQLMAGCAVRMRITTLTLHVRVPHGII